MAAGAIAATAVVVPWTSRAPQWLDDRMRGAILAVCLLMLTAACGAAGGGTAPAGPGSNAQPAQAPIAAPGQPVQGPAQRAPVQPVAPVSRATPAATPREGGQPQPSTGAGAPPCQADSPPLHKFCPGV
jgi:hypothetical protein